MNFPMRITVHKMFIYTAFLLGLPLIAAAQLPKATDDYAHTVANAAPITIAVLNNDSVGIGALRVSQIPLVNHGEARINADNTSIEFTPDVDFTGIALVNYTISDGVNTDCGLVIIDVAPTPTPSIQSMHLYTRKGQSLKFTVPLGFTAVSQGLYIVNPYIGVYQYVPADNFVGVVNLLFNKVENGFSKDFNLKIDVLDALPVTKYLVDYNISMPINTPYRTIGVLTNVRPANAGISRIEYTNINGHCQLYYSQTNTSDGNVTIVPESNYKGVLCFGYTVFYADGYKETAKVHVNVSNYEPAQDIFQITAIAQGQHQVLTYKVPEDFKDKYRFVIQNNQTFNGGIISYINGQLIYDAPANNTSYDEFMIDYCVGNVCKQNISVKVKLIAGQACSTGDCVWAGDTNNDGVVNILDLFMIGNAIGQEGAARTTTSTAFTPQNGGTWQNIPSKYIDTNGDGKVNRSDAMPILSNYGKAHSLFPEATPEESPIELLLQSSLTSVQQGDMIEVAIVLASPTAPAIDALGLSFALNYDPERFKDSNISVNFDKSNWFSMFNSYLAASKITARGKIEAGLVRCLTRGVSGHGEVGTIRGIIIVDDVNGLQNADNNVVRFHLDNPTLLLKNGQTVSLKVKDLVIPIRKTKDNEPLKDVDLSVFPNPTTDVASFYLNGINKIQYVRIINTLGREVKRIYNINDRQATIDLQNMPNGTYMAEVMTEKGRVLKKIQVLR